MRYFYIKQSDINGSTAIIGNSDAKHITTVLRLKQGDYIRLFDGMGIEYQTRILCLSSEKVTVSIENTFPSKGESAANIIIAQAVLKEKKMDHIIRQVTELGTKKMIPFIARRSIPRPEKKKLSARTERWRKIAKESVKQCRRGIITQVNFPVSFEEMLDLGKNCDLKIIFWEKELKKIDDILPENRLNIKTVFAVVGPEGGFTSDEIDTARKDGFVSAGLGPRILKSETAVVAVCTLLQYIFGDMGKGS